MTAKDPARQVAAEVATPAQPASRSVDVCRDNHGPINTGDLNTTVNMQFGERRAVQDVLQDRGILRAMLGPGPFTGRAWMRDKLTECRTGGTVVVLAPAFQ